MDLKEAKKFLDAGHPYTAAEWLVTEVERLTAEQATERVKLKGDIDALQTALSYYKKRYIGRRTQVGQISHLSEIVCTWALEHTNLGEESPEVMEAAAQLMEWFDQDRLPNHDFFSAESEKALAEVVRGMSGDDTCTGEKNGYCPWCLARSNGHCIKGKSV